MIGALVGGYCIPPVLHHNGSSQVERIFTDMQREKARHTTNMSCQVRAQASHKSSESIGVRLYPGGTPSRDRDRVRDAVAKLNTDLGFEHLHDDRECHHVHDNNIPLELIAHTSAVSDTTASYSPRSAWLAPDRSPRRTIRTTTAAHSMHREPD